MKRRRRRKRRQPPAEPFLSCNVHLWCWDTSLPRVPRFERTDACCNSSLIVIPGRLSSLHSNLLPLYPYTSR
ncbi:hypothetical protein BD311DRAFT_2306 [Dichomitus squalens]|uniref:Uncharacterized protein n=1 Tax=Dichomitus squalens TaxID=114155 RepID=A0A4V2K262_9APHY|nr:hypothetical protein BD311DRAFT_2306 [Dichomitus squalens]